MEWLLSENNEGENRSQPLIERGKFFLGPERKKGARQVPTAIQALGAPLNRFGSLAYSHTNMVRGFARKGASASLGAKFGHSLNRSLRIPH